VSILSGSKIALGVTGGIAAYKACELASQLVQAGAILDVIMTENAQRFVGPTSFQALTKRPVHVSTFEEWSDTSTGHISLAHEIDLLVVVPATANVISKLAYGAADDMLTTTALATRSPLLIAPAMEHAMYHHAATKANIELLASRGASFVGPESGRLASGEEGDGRLASIPTIIDTIRAILGRKGPLAGCHIVVTAGGTQEAIDPVRFLGNRSSGLMGYALARAAIDFGARVTLISGPTNLEAPSTAKLERINSANELKAATDRAVKDADALIMAAAVADYRPSESQTSKIKKGSTDEPVTISLVQNPDILASIDCPRLIKVGFAAETDNLIANAKAKLLEKDLAMIVANNAVETIGNPQSSAIILTPDREPDQLPQMSKDELAAEIIGRVAALIADRSS
jgi:phosphopantothenoylcysteine decarboxylase / phosphopantothenate---cysteine ligase